MEKELFSPIHAISSTNKINNDNVKQKNVDDNDIGNKVDHNDKTQDNMSEDGNISSLFELKLISSVVSNFI